MFEFSQKKKEHSLINIKNTFPNEKFARFAQNDGLTSGLGTAFDPSFPKENVVNPQVFENGNSSSFDNND